MPQGSELERPLLGMGLSCELKGNKALILTFSRCLCLGQVGQPALGHLVPGLRARSPSREMEVAPPGSVVEEASVHSSPQFLAGALCTLNWAPWPELRR